MYVRLITYHVKPWVTEAHASSIYDEMFSVMKPLAGFLGMTLLLNEDSRMAMSLSYWEDQDCATEAGPMILPLLMGRAETLVDRPPEVSGFDVVRQEKQRPEPIFR